MSQNSSTVDVFVSQENEMEVKKYLRDNNVTYKISIENIQRAIDAENLVVTDGELGVQSRAGHPMTWNAYHSLDDIYAYMDYLKNGYNSFCNTMKIGTSVEGRPIMALVIYYGSGTSSLPSTVIFMDGGMHGREWISISSVLYIMKELVENSIDYNHINTQSTMYILIPVLNPDGYEYSRTKDRLWRKNRRRGHNKARSHKHDHDRRKHKPCDGVDLNRNFGYKWGGAGSSGNECKETYRGTAPFSEPETKAYQYIVELALSHGLATNSHLGHMSLHSYGQSITFPWSYDRKVHENYRLLTFVGREMAYRMKQLGDRTYKVGSFASMFYPASGTASDWFAGDKGAVASYTVELGDTGRFGFLLPAHEIIPYGNEALNALLSFNF